MVGNDIVDLRYFESPMSQNPRYLSRVTLPGEATAVRNSCSPVVAFSAVWAAKEAAFKLFSKLGLVSHFVPRRLISTFFGDPSLSGTRGVVEFGSLSAYVCSQINEDWAHVIATSAESTVVHGQLVEEIWDRSGEFPSPEEETTAARKVAAKLLFAKGLRGHALRYNRRVPFLALADGAPSQIDISLSHHGRFVGAAIAAREASPMPCADDKWRNAGAGTMEGSCFTCMA